MSDENKPAEPVVDTSALTPAPKPAPEGDPAWLNPRLERERVKFLKDLGVENVEDAKKAIADLKAKQDAEKTTAQKAAELENTLKAQSAKTKELEDSLKLYANSLMSGLNETQKSAVLAVAGDDPAKQLKTIEALKPTWASAAAPAAPAVKDTAPAPSAPKDANGNNATPLQPTEVYEELKKTNPVLASRYAMQNGVFPNFK